MTKTWTPRLSVRVSQDQYFAMQKIIPWGVKNNLFVALVQEVLRLIETQGFDWIISLVDGTSHIEVVRNEPKKV